MEGSAVQPLESLRLPGGSGAADVWATAAMRVLAFCGGTPATVPAAAAAPLPPAAAAACDPSEPEGAGTEAAALAGAARSSPSFAACATTLARP